MTMPGSLNSEDVSSDNIIDPDSFWELIEKLLLNSSTDERARTRHNLSLSALCKSQALPPLPRPNKSLVRKDYSKKPKRNEEERNQIVLPNSINRSGKLVATGNVNADLTEKANKKEKETKLAKFREEKISIKKQKLEVPNRSIAYRGKNDKFHKEKTEVPKSDNIFREENKNVKPQKVELIKRDTTPDITEIIKTRSECSLNELRVQLVKDTNVPASERLWRFAMHNKKRTDNNNIKGAGPIPKARSNEAIYKGLRERLNEAERDAHQKEKPQAKLTAIKTTPRLEKGRPKRHICYTDRPLLCNQRQAMPSFNSTNTMATHHTRRVQFKKPLESLPKDDVRTKPFAISKQQDFDERKTQYDNVLKKRLSCGSQLESLNNEMVGKGNPRSVLNSETTKKYNELKTEYLKLCYRESQLRHQIAMIHAEIYMMQNKCYHKTPAAVKTITLDSKTTPLQPKSDLVDQYPHLPDSAPFFPPLKPPRPLLQQSRVGQERVAERFDAKKQRICHDKEEKDSLLELARGNLSHASVCSVYSLTPGVTPPPKHEPTIAKENRIKEERSLIKLIHRLPKLKSTERLYNTHANKC